MVARGADPNQSCQTLQQELKQNSKFREDNLTNCVTVLSARVKVSYLIIILLKSTIFDISNN